MRLLHTSDWHLGARLAEKDRKDTQEKFLHWLAQTIKEQNVDALLVAGDIFDNSTPNHAAQSLFYTFLADVRHTGCRNIVVTGGNHDSASFLEAPRELLSAFSIWIVGAANSDLDREIIPLRSADNALEAVICAVPFLREKDLLSFSESENFAAKDQKIAKGIADHYRAVFKKAEALREGKPVPIIALGHLFACGAQTSDSERSAYVGSLGQVGLDAFPEQLDYLALGHIHRPQIVGGNSWRRYSGSPYPIDFSEADQTKEVILLEFRDGEKTLTPIRVPSFENLSHIQGNADAIRSALNQLIDSGESVLCAVDYTDTKPAPGLMAELRALAEPTKVSILRFRDHSKLADPQLFQQDDVELFNLDPQNVFTTLLESIAASSDEEKEKLQRRYQEILQEIDAGSED